MNLDRVFVCDIETVGMLEDIKSFDDLHVFSCCYQDSEGLWQIKSTNKFEDIQKVVGNPNNTLIFHNGICYDKPVLEKMGFDFKASVIDTLGVSYYLYSERDKHGLGEWGEYFGVPKPAIESWVGLPYETYVERCEEDVKINTNLWLMMLKFARELYEGDDDLICNTIRYLNFKLEKLFCQQENKILIDVEQCKKNLEFLESIIEEKSAILNSIMPKIPVTSKKTKPKVMFKKDGSLSANGAKWLDLCQKVGVPEDYSGEINVVVKYKEPNCASSVQMKDFLLSKGWKPTIYKDGANGKVAQLRDDDKNLCPNIVKLCKEYPELEALEGLSVAQHRAGYLKGFLNSVDEDGYVNAWAHGFTKTLRLKHVSPFANLPKPSAKYGELVRSVMIAPPGYVCFGADLSSIEDKSKQISIYPIDPEYVLSMNTKGWDAHLALGQKAGFFDEEDVQFFKWFKSRDKKEPIGECPPKYTGMSEEDMHIMFEELSLKRAISKTGTYSLTYGCGVPKLAESTGLSKKEAKKLYDGFHSLNWSVKEFADRQKIKTVRGANFLKLNKKAGGLQQVAETDWVWSEVSQMWLFLKNRKDCFSALNQHFGVKIFDTWAYYMYKRGIKFSGEWHDEEFWYCPEDRVEEHKAIIETAITLVNKKFDPPVPIECDFQVGSNYAEVH